MECFWRSGEHPEAWGLSSTIARMSAIQTRLWDPSPEGLARCKGHDAGHCPLPGCGRSSGVRATHVAALGDLLRHRLNLSDVRRLHDGCNRESGDCLAGKLPSSSPLHLLFAPGSATTDSNFHLKPHKLRSLPQCRQKPGLVAIPQALPLLAWILRQPRRNAAPAETRPAAALRRCDWQAVLGVAIRATSAGRPGPPHRHRTYAPAQQKYGVSIRFPGLVRPECWAAVVCRT